MPTVKETPFTYDQIPEELREATIREIVRQAIHQQLAANFGVARGLVTPKQYAETKQKADSLAAAAKKEGVDGPYLYAGDKQKIFDAHIAALEEEYIQVKLKEDAGLPAEVSTPNGAVAVTSAALATQKAAMMKIGTDGPPEREDAPPTGLAGRQGIL